MQSSSTTHQRRKTKLIDRSLQLRFASRLSIILVANLVLFLVLSVMTPAAVSLLAGKPIEGAFDSLLRLEYVFSAVLVPLVICFLSMLAYGFRETLKVAGPNYRFRNVLQHLRSRRIPQGLRIRDNDYLQETAEEFNEALGILHTSLADLQNLCRRADQALQGADPSPESIAKAREFTAQMRASLEHFTFLGIVPPGEVIGSAADAIEPLEEVPAQQPVAASGA